jgi:hypothetical protein
LLTSWTAYLTITIHNKNEQDFIWNEIKKFLPGPLKIEKEEGFIESWLILDKNNVTTYVAVNDEFSQSAIRQNSLGNLTLHQSDPVKAHEICCMAHNDTVHFINGKIYKCGPAQLFAEFDQQHQLDISDADRELLSLYKPLTVDNFAEYHKEFFENLPNPIAQCKFCPEEHNMRKIYPLVKGA